MGTPIEDLISKAREAHAKRQAHIAASKEVARKIQAENGYGELYPADGSQQSGTPAGGAR